MRVLTYNIHGWQTIACRPNHSLVAEVLNLADADVIALNEVYHPAPVATGSALGWLAGQLGMSYAFAACEARKIPGASTSVSYGNALLSRMPLASASSGLFSALPGKEQRGYLEGRIDVGCGQIFTVVVTHLDHTDENARLTQIEDLFNRVGRVAGMPDLIMGDFNCVHPRDYVNRPDAFVRLSSHSLASHMANQPEGPRVVARMEERRYTEALIHEECLGNGTFILAADPVRLDYIWLSSETLPALAHVGIFEHPCDQEASDHRAVFADLFSPGS
jgi:endonuclease/exonuclease/phosphatase family metal-dependent hydrolase